MPLANLANSPSGARPTIGHVLHTLNVGGAEILARQFAHFSRAEFRFVFACLDTLGSMGQTLQEEGFEVFVLGRRPGLDVRCAWRLGRWLKRANVRLVHAHQYGPFFYSALARRLSRHTPILLTEHGRDYPDYRRPKRVLANRWLLARNDRLVGVGDCVRRALIDNEGFPASRVEVIRNAVDTSRSETPPRLRQELRTEWGVAPHDPVIIQVARLNRLKDHVTALRMMELVTQRLHRARLVLVGDGEERPALEQLARQLGLERQVIFFGERSDVADILPAADLFLLTSITEGIPLTLIEAMAAGLPCVTTDVGGNGEVLVDGETGLLAEPGQPEDLAEKVCRLIADLPLRARLGRAGRERAVAEFDHLRMHQAYQLVYRQMLKMTSDATGDSGRQSVAAGDSGHTTQRMGATK